MKKKKIKNRHNKRRKKKQLVNALMKKEKKLLNALMKKEKKLLNALMKKEKKLLNAYQGPSNKQCKSPQEMLFLLNTRQLLTKINRLFQILHNYWHKSSHPEGKKKKKKKKPLATKK